MTKPKSGAPPADAKAACSFIEPPDFLKHKVVKGQGWDLEAIERRAAEAIESMRYEFLDCARRDLLAMQSAVERAKSGYDPIEALKAVYRLAHDLRGQAGTFGYPLISTIASSLCDYIDEAQDPGSVQLEAIEVHSNAMKAVIAADIQGDGGATGNKLLTGMARMVTATLKRKRDS
ncbi:MAG: Hpt domain-containing protein [Kiloniellales bacterium]|nr:Hpt domain-containing protein [Kiloniellales bacterium]